MELNILNPDSNDFCEAVGIAPERQKELSIRLDEMVRRFNNEPIKIVKMHAIYAEIASYCQNNAELMYCTTLHCGWHARQGRVLAPGPLDYGRIALGIQMLVNFLRGDVNHPSWKTMKKLLAGNEEQEIKEGAREGVQRLLDVGQIKLAKDIMNKLTGFAF